MAKIASVIAKNKGPLVELVLSGNKMGDAGALHLSDAIHRSTTLAKLHLAGCNIGDEGVGGIADALAQNSTVVQLDLRYNKIGAR